MRITRPSGDRSRRFVEEFKPLAVRTEQLRGASRRPTRRLECVRKPFFQSLAIRKQMIALARCTKAR